MNQHLLISREVKEALAQGKPVVALESTIISHGMPYPQNLETAQGCERVAREHGAVPATCAILGGKLCVGLEADQLDYLARTGTKVIKASRRDIPLLVAKKLDGATTVTGTMILAAMAGVRIHATGGIGGVHRGAQETMDISADLEELGKTPVVVVCAGAKSILFGDMSYYWIADREGRTFQRLNELYAPTGQVGFLSFERVDGKLILPEAVQCLQMKAGA